MVRQVETNHTGQDTCLELDKMVNETVFASLS